MSRNLTIKEFVNSFAGKDSFFSNTLKYLYNADNQNGLYICKGPDLSGFNHLVRLLTLYRLARLIFNPCSEEVINTSFSNSDPITNIIWYTDNVKEAFNAFMDTLKSSSLFLEESTAVKLHDSSILDKIHIYYNVAGMGMLHFDGVDVTFTNKPNPDYLDGHHYFGLIYERASYCETLNKPEVKIFNDWFDDLLTKDFYKNAKTYKLNTFRNDLVPFCIINSRTIFQHEPIEFNDINRIEVTAPSYNYVLEDSQLSHLIEVDILKDYLKENDYVMYNKNMYIDKVLKAPNLNKVSIALNTEDSIASVFGLYKGWDYGPRKTESHTEEDNLNKLECFIKKGPKYARLISNQTAYMNNFLRDKTKLEQRDIFKKLSDILQVKLNTPEDVIDHIINVFETPLECTLTASFDPDNAPTGWKALETARSALQEDGEELSPCDLQNLYCDRDTLMKEINETHSDDELLILIPLKLDTGDIYGIWRKNLLRKYYSNVLI